MVSVPMALVDLIPCILFLMTALIIQKDLYGKMSRGAYSLYAAGSVMVFTAGTCKALWKLLMALQVCDFEKLNSMFFPLQSFGFILAGLGLLLFVCCQKKSPVMAVAAPAVYSGTMLFVVLMIVGVGCTCGSLMVLAKRLGRKTAILLFAAAFVLLLGMGYLSSRNFDRASMHWIAEGVNTVAQLVLFAGTLILHKAGLGELKN